MQRFFQNRIETQIPAPQLLVDDRPQLVTPGIRRELTAGPPDFLRNANANRPVPRRRYAEAGPEVRAHVLPAKFLPGGSEDVEAGLEPVRPSVGNLHRLMPRMLRPEPTLTEFCS